MVGPARRALAVLVAAGALTGFLPVRAVAQSASKNRSLAVGVPADAVPIQPGTSAPVSLRVVNAGRETITVRITAGEAELGDQGRVAILDRPDPTWDGRVAFPRRPITLKPMSYRDVAVVVHMPPQLSPDLYFVGFLVTPIASHSGQVSVVNQIGSFFTINVPGPRVRSLKASLTVDPSILWGIRIPWFVLGSRAHGDLAIANTGPSAVQFWGEIDGWTRSNATIASSRLDRSLLPIGRKRSYALVSKHVWLIGFTTVRTVIIYPKNDEQTTTQIELVRRVLIISPWLIVAIVVLILFLAWYLIRRRRRNRRRAKGPTAVRAPERAPLHVPS